MSTNKDSQTSKVIVIPSKATLSRKITEGEIPKGLEETEIAVQIIIPQEGGWGWVVVFASLTTITIMDGMAFTFGAMFSDLTEDIQSTASSVAFINAVAQAMYFMQSPVVTAFINRFGFRATCMTGSLMVSFGLTATYFSTNFFAIIFFYGLMTGTGFCFINLSCLIVGFYFEKLRSLALSITMCGSSLGIMLFYPINAYIVEVAGWRYLVLLHAGLNGLSFFLALTYRPLLSLSVEKLEDHKSFRSMTYLPSLSRLKNIEHVESKLSVQATVTERLFGAVSSVNYPTAAQVVNKDSNTSIDQPGPSDAPTRQSYGISVKAQTAPGGMSSSQMDQAKSMIKKATVTDKDKELDFTNIKTEEPKKSSCWARLCNWDKHVPQSRPMYKDDVFYGGKLKSLPAHRKSIKDSESKTGLEYQLAVTRAASVADLQDRRGLCTISIRRVLATMMAPNLLKQKSFMLVCISGLLLYVAFTVPFVFLQDRNLSFGLDPKHCALFVSAIGFMNVVGRVVVGAIACKYDPLKLYILVNILSGVSTILSDISHSIFYQYFYSCFFGFFISPTAGLRSMVLVNICGLDDFTNASGIAFLFQGLGCLTSTPIASVIKTHLGDRATFIWAGLCMILSGFLLLPVQKLANKEKENDVGNYLT